MLMALARNEGSVLGGGRGLQPSFLVQLIPVTIRGPQVETGTHNLKNIRAIISKLGVLWDVRAAQGDNVWVARGSVSDWERVRRERWETVTYRGTD